MTDLNLPDDASLETIMAHYIERIELGEDADPHPYLKRFPNHTDELKTFFRNHHWLDESEPETSSLVGKSIGPYEIESELARGGICLLYTSDAADE